MQSLSFGAIVNPILKANIDKISNISDISVLSENVIVALADRVAYEIALTPEIAVHRTMETKSVVSIAASSTSGALAILSASGILTVIDSHTSELRWRFEFGFSVQYASLAFSENGREIVVLAQPRNQLLVFTLDSSNPRADYSRRISHTQDFSVGRVALSPDSRFVAVTACDHVRVLGKSDDSQIDLGKGLFRFDVRMLAISSVGLLVASDGFDVLLWRSADWERHNTVEPLLVEAGVSLSFNADGSELAVASSVDRLVWVYKIPSGKLTSVLGGLGNKVACVAYTPDNNNVVVASYDGEISIFAPQGTSQEIASNVQAYRQFKRFQ